MKRTVITSSIKKVRDIVRKERRKGKVISFVPTMGMLHEGHLSLVRNAKKSSDFVVVSIFVNPKQFGPNEDFEKYPRNFKRDKELLEKENVDLIFYPKASHIYSSDFSVYVDEDGVSKNLCGKSRPGHFRGVLTIVSKFFNIVLPDIAFFGQKDYQQALLIKKMTKDLNFPVKIKICPIKRERSGLALSSRNQYLSERERLEASVFYKALKIGKELVNSGEKSTSIIKKKMARFISDNCSEAKIDYIEILDKDRLTNIKYIKSGAVIAIAVFFKKVRLIDNIIV